MVKTTDSLQCIAITTAAFLQEAGPVNIGCGKVSLHPYCSDVVKPETGHKYSLAAVVNHVSRTNGTSEGHYTATCKSPTSGNWQECDDAIITNATCPSGSNKRGYLLFYTHDR